MFIRIGLALMLGAVFVSGNALADTAAPQCVDVSKPKATVAALHGHWVDLDASQWEFLRGVYAMNPETPLGLPFGDRAALARFDGDPRGIVFFIDDKKACTPMLAPPEILSMVADVAARAIKHQGAGL